MKKLLVITFTLLIASSAWAADFAPTQLILTADSQIMYDFDGSDLAIDVNVRGTNAGLIFSVFTKGEADNIAPLQNGYLGWHYVNKIDTCIYYSTLTPLGIGD